MNKEELKQLVETLVALDNLIEDKEVRNNEIYEDFQDWIDTLDNQVQLKRRADKTTETMKVSTLDSVSIKRLIKQMQSDRLEQLMTLNDNKETVKVELYAENESIVEPKEHLRYVIYHDNGLETEWLFDYNGNQLYQSTFK